MIGMMAAGMRGRFDGRTRSNKRVPDAKVDEICRPKHDVNPDFSVQHFHERAVEKHGLRVSYTFTCPVLVHELLDDSLGVSFSGKLIARFDRQGTALSALTRAA